MAKKIHTISVLEKEINIYFDKDSLGFSASWGNQKIYSDSVKGLKRDLCKFAYSDNLLDEIYIRYLRISAQGQLIDLGKKLITLKENGKVLMDGAANNPFTNPPGRGSLKLYPKAKRVNDLTPFVFSYDSALFVFISGDSSIDVDIPHLIRQQQKASAETKQRNIKWIKTVLRLSNYKTRDRSLKELADFYNEKSE